MGCEWETTIAAQTIIWGGSRVKGIISVTEHLEWTCLDWVNYLLPCICFPCFWRSCSLISSGGIPSIPYISISMLERFGSELGTLSMVSLWTCERWCKSVMQCDVLSFWIQVALTPSTKKLKQQSLNKIYKDLNLNLLICSLLYLTFTAVNISTLFPNPLLNKTTFYRCCWLL